MEKHNIDDIIQPNPFIGTDNVNPEKSEITIMKKIMLQDNHL